MLGLAFGDDAVSFLVGPALVTAATIASSDYLFERLEGPSESTVDA